MKRRSVDKYEITVRALSEEDGGGYYAEVLDIPQCAVCGETPEEALAECRNALETVLELYEEKGISPPPPINRDLYEYSGKFVLRLPRTLHRRLALAAQDERVSINQLCVSMLAGCLSGNSRQTTSFTYVQQNVTFPELEVAEAERGEQDRWRLQDPLDRRPGSIRLSGQDWSDSPRDSRNPMK